MYRSAEITSLIYPLQELQDRVSLEVPAAFIKEEGIRESGDQQMARYGLMHYTRADNDPDGDEMDVQAIVERLAHEVLDDYEIVWEVTQDERGRNTLYTVITVTWPEEPQEEPFFAEAGYHTANDALDIVPLTVYADQDVYNVATDGNDFQVLLNGKKVLDDAPSAAYALGCLVPLLRDALTEIEINSGMEPSGANDFLAGIAVAFIDTPDLTDEAKEHFVKFFELTTLKDWEAATEEDSES